MVDYVVERATKDDRSFIEIAELDKVAWRHPTDYRQDEDHSDGEVRFTRPAPQRPRGV